MRKGPSLIISWWYSKNKSLLCCNEYGMWLAWSELEHYQWLVCSSKSKVADRQMHLRLVCTSSDMRQHVQISASVRVDGAGRAIAAQTGGGCTCEQASSMQLWKSAQNICVFAWTVCCVTVSDAARSLWSISVHDTSTRCDDLTMLESMFLVVRMSKHAENKPLIRLSLYRGMVGAQLVVQAAEALSCCCYGQSSSCKMTLRIRLEDYLFYKHYTDL